MEGDGAGDKLPKSWAETAAARTAIKKTTATDLLNAIIKQQRYGDARKESIQILESWRREVNWLGYKTKSQNPTSTKDHTKKVVNLRKKKWKITLPM